jgi:hypothetical protein
LLSVAAALGVYASLIEPDRLVVNEVRIPLPGWPEALDDLRVAVLTDIHAGSPHIDLEKLDRIVATVNREEADLVVLLGDYVIRGVLGGREGGRRLFVSVGIGTSILPVRFGVPPEISLLRISRRRLP